MGDDRKRLLARWAALQNERASWLEHWRDLSDFILPRRSRFLSTERNKGAKRNQNIINNTPTRASRILASGMMAGITSPARPWFRLTTPDPDLAEVGAVREWLHAVEQRMRLAFARSNIYNCLHSKYRDLGTFGTSATVVEADAQDVLRGYVLPIGQYALANSARHQVDTLYRELSMTVGQLVEQFGAQACTAQVREAHGRGDLDSWRRVLHVVEPNRSHKPGALGPAGHRWASVWLELEADASQAPLRQAGYAEFPVLAPRWDVTGEDVYGSSPGMEVLGDVKALQLLERRKAQAADKLVNPPMRAPSSLMNGRASLLPGDITYVDVVSGGQQFAPAFEMNPAALKVLEESVQQHSERINSGYYADLWLMMAQGDSRQVTAREVAERHEEKMLQLGPVLERLQDELLDPLIDRTFSILLRQNYLPPPPEELQGVDLRVEFISILAQAQKLLGTSAVERLAGFVGNVAAVRPDALDNVDWDETVRDYGEMLGVKPTLLMDGDKVTEIRAHRAAQQQAQQQAAQSLQAAQGAKTLSETDMQGDTALNRLVGNLGGVAAGAAGATPAGGTQ